MKNLVKSSQRPCFYNLQVRLCRDTHRIDGFRATNRRLRCFSLIVVAVAVVAILALVAANWRLRLVEARRVADGRGPTAVTADPGERRGWSRPVPALAGYDALLGTIR